MLSVWTLLNVFSPGKALALSQTTKFRLFQTEKFADDNFNFDENGRRFSKRVENTGGMFSKNFYCRHIKNRACLGKS